MSLVWHYPGPARDYAGGGIDMRRPLPYAGRMSGLASLSPSLAGAGSAEGGTGIAMLKKSQDLMSRQAAQLLAALPPAPAPSLAGMGRTVDIMA